MDAHSILYIYVYNIYIYINLLTDTTHLVHMGQQTLLAALARRLTHQLLGVRGKVFE